MTLRMATMMCVVALFASPAAGQFVNAVGTVWEIRYDKDELENLTPDQARELGVMVKLELSRRRI